MRSQGRAWSIDSTASLALSDVIMPVPKQVAPAAEPPVSVTFHAWHGRRSQAATVADLPRTATQSAWTAAPPGRRRRLHASHTRLSPSTTHRKKCSLAPEGGRLLSDKGWRTKAATEVVAGSVGARPARAALGMLS